MYGNKLQIAPMDASELQTVLAVGGDAGIFNPSTRTKSASFVHCGKCGSVTKKHRFHVSVNYMIKMMTCLGEMKGD